ncbi:MAG TPA: glycoside hydrolase family 43 protein [Tepidisphaeraceae bacterium]|nr:glycoside hydrolase family 43 protein [Tepidisphaeraceae bacterium]
MKILFLLLAIASPACASAASGGFLFSTFRDETTPLSEQIYFAVSEDGKQWEALNGGGPVLVSNVGERGVRDSFLLRSHNGRKVWLIATDLSVNRNRNWKRNTRAGSRSLVIWESTDLVHWSPPRLARVAPEGAGCAWAPEAIYDEETGDYLVYWASTSRDDNYSKQRIWAAHTKDFRTFDKPFVYVEESNHVIDIDVVRDGDTYFRFTKDDKTKSVSMASSRRLMGPWHEMEQFTAGTGKNFEGPICFQLKPAVGGRRPVWCLLLDDVSDRIGSGAFGYVPFVSSDLSTGKFTRASDFHFPYPFRHGSVLPITTAERERLESAYPSPARPH